MTPCNPHTSGVPDVTRHLDLQGLGNNSSDYDDMVRLLEAQGFPCEVARVARVDWLRNAAGLLQRDYWRGTLQPRPVLDWWVVARAYCRQVFTDGQRMR